MPATSPALLNRQRLRLTRLQQTMQYLRPVALSAIANPGDDKPADDGTVDQIAADCLQFVPHLCGDTQAMGYVGPPAVPDIALFRRLDPQQLVYEATPSFFLWPGTVSPTLRGAGSLWSFPQFAVRTGDNLYLQATWSWTTVLDNGVEVIGGGIAVAGAELFFSAVPGLDNQNNLGPFPNGSTQTWIFPVGKVNADGFIITSYSNPYVPPPLQ